MLSPLWWVPLIVTAAAIIPLWLATRRLAQELAALRSSADGLRKARSVLNDVRDQILAARRSLQHLGRR